VVNIIVLMLFKANGLVDRTTMTIQTSMLKIVQENQECWPQVLPGVLFAYRTSKQSSTGFSPFFLLYGRTAKLPTEYSQSESDNQLSECFATEIIDDFEMKFHPDEIRERLQAIIKVRGDITKTAAENISQAKA